MAQSRHQSWQPRDQSWQSRYQSWQSRSQWWQPQSRQKHDWWAAWAQTKEGLWERRRDSDWIAAQARDAWGDRALADPVRRRHGVWGADGLRFGRGDLDSDVDADAVTVKHEDEFQCPDN